MEESGSRGGWLATLSYFIAWMVTSAGSIIDALLVREALLAVLAWYKVISTEAYHQQGGVGDNLITSFGVAAVDNVMLLVLGCGAIAATVWIEYYFRKGRPMGLLYQRIGKVFAVEIAIIIAALLIRQFISGII
jgi:hypothetical protein